VDGVYIRASRRLYRFDCLQLHLGKACLELCVYLAAFMEFIAGNLSHIHWSKQLADFSHRHPRASDHFALDEVEDHS
jgi:hypothetical protein